MSDVLKRIFSFVEHIPPTTCWFWVGAVFSNKAKNKQPCMKLGGRVVPVRRLMYELEVGEIHDAGVRVSVSCGHDLCVNPDHLRLRAGRDIGAEGLESQKKLRTHKTRFRCGHKVTKANSSHKSKDGYRYTTCRRCELESKRKYARSERRRISRRKTPW